MTTRTPMSRTEAARLLGVDVSADPDTVRHAWRMWARVAHPDAGGDPQHFARLDQARRVLSTPQLPAAAASAPAPARERWSNVLERPRHPIAGLVGAAIAVASAALSGSAGASPTMIQLASLALLASVAACGVAVGVSREVLADRADRGHRMATISALWSLLAGLQLVTAAVVGVSLVPVLPVMALPIVALVGAMNLGAGLWRPVQVGGSRPTSSS